MVAEKAQAVKSTRGEAEAGTLRTDDGDARVEIGRVDVSPAPVVVPETDAFRSGVEQRVRRRIQLPRGLAPGDFPLLRAAGERLIGLSDYQIYAFQIAKQQNSLVHIVLLPQSSKNTVPTDHAFTFGTVTRTVSGQSPGTNVSSVGGVY